MTFTKYRQNINKA